MKIRTSTFLLSLMIVAISGCPSQRYRVEIRSKPKGASVEVTRSARSVSERPFLLPKDTPVTHDFDFGASGVIFDLNLSLERYLDRPEQLTVDYVRNLPQENHRRILTIPLKRARYYNIEKAEVVIDPTKGLVVRIRRVRAFEEDIERDGVPASKIAQLGEGMWFGGVTIDPEGKRIIFAVVERGHDERDKEVQYSNIRAINVAGGGITQITTGRWMDVDPCFSPDGKHLYFASDRLRNGRLDLFRINSLVKGSGIASIHRQPKGWSRSPVPSETGLISFMYQPEYSSRTGVQQVWTIGGVNQYPTALTEGSQPHTSPDGTKIVYIGPDKKLWVVPISAQTPVQLTSNPDTQESDPTWSPDSTHIIYVSNEGKDSTGKPNNDIWLMRADGTERRQLTTNGSDDSDPVVDPLKRWVYFISNRGYKSGIWRIPWPIGMGG